MPQLVAECIEGIDRIRRIVDAMQRFSRVPSDEFGSVDVNRVVEDAIRSPICTATATCWSRACSNPTCRSSTAPLRASSRSS